MDKEMYFNMSIGDQNPVIDRGIALHKMIRLISLSLGGDAYLNFMGNEFGHPEWIDFPREGNGWSYKYARRQWSLADDPKLKYQYLAAFDEAMLDMVKKNDVLSSPLAQTLNMDNNNKVIVFERSDLIFIFNFSVGNSIFDYKFKAHKPGTYHVIFNSDDQRFGGFNRIDDTIAHHTDDNQMLSLYVTNRTAIVLKRELNEKEKKNKEIEDKKNKEQEDQNMNSIHAWDTM
jgi:1,4-alpha-glucan branching enzyme